MQKIGLVFSGGGGKGAYEVGVWRAMEELGLAKDIQAVSGTSVGALNAALFAQGDLHKAEQAWLSMSPSDILSIDLKSILEKLLRIGVTPGKAIVNILTTLAIHGIFKRDGLARIIDEYLDTEIVKSRGLPCFACATETPILRAHYFDLQSYDKELVRNILLASSAIPVIFPTEKIEDKIYWDGFLTDNTPLQPLVDEGCNIIVTVMLSRSDLLSTDQYPNTKIIPIYPQECPGLPLNFSGISEKMQHGYDDAMKTLAPVFELVEINYQYSKELQKYKSQHQEYIKLRNESEVISTQIDFAKTDLLKEMNKW